LRAPGKKTKKPKIAAAALSARLNSHFTLEMLPDGSTAARFEDYAVPLGKFSAGAASRAAPLRTGLPLRSFSSSSKPVDREVDVLVRRLARHGLLEYRFGPLDGHDRVVIEPQTSEYWPQTPKLADADIVVLSRFAYLRRRGGEMVLESPRAGALFRICDPGIAAALAMLSAPQQLRKFRRQDGFPGIELLALLVDCQILFKVDTTDSAALRSIEGDDSLVLWDFHDLLFHTHSTEGRQANLLGGLYPFAGVMPPPPAVRPRWPGRKIDLQGNANGASGESAAFADLVSKRHSTRDFDDARPIALGDLARFLGAAARIKSKWKSRIDFDEKSPEVDYTTRPYPSGGSAYELELYLTVARCEGLTRGFYHYDPDRHALVSIEARSEEMDAQLATAEFAMDALGPPQILITIAARFDRVSWKYSSIAYALILKNVGVLIQTLYLTATELGLGGCAIGSTNIDLFAKMTGIAFHVEGPVGQFALGRSEQATDPA
jgi:SagB-type dehydrogenase family enzyme